MTFKRLALVAALSLAFGGQAIAADAEPAPASAAAASGPAPLTDYLRLPQYFSPRLSPNGKYLVVATPVNGRLNLAIVDLETRKGAAITSFADFDVLRATWIGNERIVFSLGQLNAPSGFSGADGGGLFVVSRDGSEQRVLSPTAGGAGQSGGSSVHGMSFQRRIRYSTDEILVAAALRSSDSEDIYRLDLRTGRTSLVTVDRPARTTGFILDQKLVPRVAISTVKDALIEIVWYRSSADAPWKELTRFTTRSTDAFEPLGFLNDGKTMLVSASPGRNTRAIFKYDPETRQLGEMVAQSARFDMGRGSIVLEPETDRLIGYHVEADKPVTVWLDEREAKTQALLDRAFPKMVNSFSRFPSSSRVLVTSYSDVSPAKYFLFDEDKKTLEELFDSKPWLGPNSLVEMRPFVLKTRDGLEIPSYYFLPKGYKAGDKLPTIVHIHGGPQVRADTWANGYGYEEAELLASRGYAVVLPNFRITPGFGNKILRAGFGAVGRQMSDDHEDAARWAIAQGFADPARMCIVGASYGGYATLVAMAKAPDLFKCGVAGLPVTDWQAIIDSPLSNSAYGSGPEYVKLILGEAKSKTALQDYSPVNMASRIKGAVFMWEGTDDSTTPVEQTRSMARALERAGNPPKTVMIKTQEAHGYGRLENRLDLYEQMLKFLDGQIGSKHNRSVARRK